MKNSKKGAKVKTAPKKSVGAAITVHSQGRPSKSSFAIEKRGEDRWALLKYGAVMAESVTYTNSKARSRAANDLAKLLGCEVRDEPAPEKTSTASAMTPQTTLPVNPPDDSDGSD